ncbi:MAG TPA: signal peptidase II [Candidatus Limnocylindrales bacterium]|nr:signal peptidase II [Candidatus Limnocylindrales bacterium]
MADLRLRAYGAAAAIFALDRITKLLVDAGVSDYATYRIIPGVFDIVRSENRGVAFGILNNSASQWRTIALIVASLVAVIAIAVALWRSPAMDRVSAWALALILGGAAGNLYDRAILGRVTDFIQVYLGSYAWPTFNIADSAIVIGSGLLLLSQMKPKRQPANVP